MESKLSEKDDNKLWQGRGHVEYLDDHDEPVLLVGNPPEMTISPASPSALEVAQQIIDEFGPPGMVTAWRAVENQANVVELDLADGSTVKFVGLFAHHILSAHHRDTH